MSLIAFTGHRPDKLGGYVQPNPTSDAVKAAITLFLKHERPDRIISGMALGVDQWAAQAARVLGIPYIAAVPFEGFESRWPAPQKALYRRLIDAAQQVVYVCGIPGIDAFQQRNVWMVDACNLLAAVWNGSPGGTANCVAYATRKGVPIRRLEWKESA